MAAGNIGQAKSRETVHMILDSAVDRYYFKYSINLIMTGAALLWCFATRHSTQAMAIVLVKCCNAVARHHSGARRVGLSTSMAALRLLRRTKAIRGETCLALNADRPTASVIIRLIEY